MRAPFVGVGRNARRERPRTSSDEWSVPGSILIALGESINVIYNRAMRWNKGLDRDKDGVACEKH
jgi:hypothetical protein